MAIVGWLPIWEQIGKVLSYIWLGMGLSLLMGSIFGAHQAALVVYSWLAWSRGHSGPEQPF
jgi:hypothetical protein